MKLTVEMRRMKGIDVCSDIDSEQGHHVSISQGSPPFIKHIHRILETPQTQQIAMHVRTCLQWQCWISPISEETSKRLAPQRHVPVTGPRVGGDDVLVRRAAAGNLQVQKKDVGKVEYRGTEHGGKCTCAKVRSTCNVSV